jgi:hypothetical protein
MALVKIRIELENLNRAGRIFEQSVATGRNEGKEGGKE